MESSIQLRTSSQLAYDDYITSSSFHGSDTKGLGAFQPISVWPFLEHAIDELHHVDVVCESGFTFLSIRFAEMNFGFQ